MLLDAHTHEAEKRSMCDTLSGVASPAVPSTGVGGEPAPVYGNRDHSIDQPPAFSRAIHAGTCHRRLLTSSISMP